MSVFIIARGLLHVVGCGAQARKLEHECEEHDASEVASVCPLAEDVRNGSSCEYAHHVHYAVSCGTITGRDNLAEYGHVVGIEHTEAHSEEQSGSDDGDDAMSETEEHEGGNGHSQSDGTRIYTSAYVALHPVVLQDATYDYANERAGGNGDG